jgi:DNA replication protein DnaC
MALATGDARLTQRRQFIAVWAPSGGKSHLAAALVENGCRVLFTRTTDLVQRLQIARARSVTPAASHTRVPDGRPFIAAIQSPAAVSRS